MMTPPKPLPVGSPGANFYGCTCGSCPRCGKHRQGWQERNVPNPPLGCECYTAGRKGLWDALRRDPKIGPLLSRFHVVEPSIYGNPKESLSKGGGP